VLVFAVSVLVGEDVAGGMRLVASDAEGERDVTELGSDVIVEGLDLVDFGLLVFRQFKRFGLQFRSGLDALALKRGIPLA